jgi:hypothetical protein
MTPIPSLYHLEMMSKNYNETELRTISLDRGHLVFQVLFNCKINPFACCFGFLTRYIRIYWSIFSISTRSVEHLENSEFICF